MTRFTIQVSDRRGKYPAKTYTVEAEQEFEAYGPATEQFIRDNGHRARGPSERISSYYARFWNQRVPDETPQVPVLEFTIARMKREVLEDIASGRVPPTVTSFSDLDDHVDANEYGGFCEDELSDALIAHYGGRDQDEGMPDGMMKYTRDAQDAIGRWVKEGGHLKAD